jgi:hypothetical protein
MHGPASIFPCRGKLFSIAWKKPEKVFHSVEKTGKSFPYRGKTAGKFSIAWKNREHVFHSVET